MTEPRTETLHGTPVGEHLEIQPSGMQKDYVVLSDEERAKGFVRPVRRSYRHVGALGPKNPVRDLAAEEKERYGAEGYVKFEEYPKSESSAVVGRFWTREQLTPNGCGVVTTMGVKLAETYARQPNFYGGTFCSGCGSHRPVGADGEFVWDDGSGERVGT